ncbi:MAG: pyridoxal phosphate-dependent aminotransferase [Candidatus Hodarchaeales archaeon]|jgi:aspartate/methionine/tyrosine aminotransferase
MISNQISNLEGSLTGFFLKLAKKRASEGHNVINLGIGQPDFQPLDPIIQSTLQAITEGKTTYTINSGIPELRQAVSQAYLDDIGEEIDPNTEIKITIGAKQGILGSFFTILNRGDKILLQEPYYLSYPDMARLAGAEFVPISMMDDYSLNQDEILTAFSEKKIKAFMINSPNNPSGHVLSSDEIKFLKDLVEDKNIFIISDEIYSDFTYIDTGLRSLLSEFKNWRENIIVVNGFAKTHSMTGFRLGWTISHPAIAEGILKLIMASTTCASAFCQWAGVTALRERFKARDVITKIFPQRRNILVEEVKKTDGLSIKNIDGAFYGFIRYSFTDKPSYEVAKDILVNTDVCVIPGSAFGASADDYIRVTFSRSIEEIREAFTRIREYIKIS